MFPLPARPKTPSTDHGHGGCGPPPVLGWVASAALNSNAFQIGPLFCNVDRSHLSIATSRYRLHCLHQYGIFGSLRDNWREFWSDCLWIFKQHIFIYIYPLSNMTSTSTMLAWLTFSLPHLVCLLYRNHSNVTSRFKVQLSPPRSLVQTTVPTLAVIVCPNRASGRTSNTSAYAPQTWRGSAQQPRCPTQYSQSPDCQQRLQNRRYPSLFCGAAPVTAADDDHPSPYQMLSRATSCLSDKWMKWNN